MRFFHGGSGAFLAMVAVLLVSPALARTTSDVAGDWSGSSKTKVRVQRLGSDRDRSANDLSVYADGTWAVHDDEDFDYTGTWSPRGRKLRWNYDNAGRTELEDMLDGWADSYGYSTSTTMGRLRTKGKAKVRRGVKTLKVTVNGKFRMNVRGKSRRGTVKIVGTYRPD